MTERLSPDADPDILCYVQDGVSIDIHPASHTRAWMDDTPNRHAYRCLPLSIANSHGWEIRCQRTISALWNGGRATSDIAFTIREDPMLTVEHAGTSGVESPGDTPVLSSFGSGIITFHVPCLFRTPPGIDLWVMGPPNHIKDGIQPLSGIVETDWLTEHGFTMNWKITRPYHEVRFERGEPYCFITPIPRGLLEQLQPAVRRFDDAPEIRDQYLSGAEERHRFQQDIGVRQQGLARHAPVDSAEKWQRSYFQGRDAAGELIPDHRTKVRARPFERTARSSTPADGTASNADANAEASTEASTDA